MTDLGLMALIGFGLLCGCTGCAFWLLMSDGYMRSVLKKTLSREVSQSWSRLGDYRVRVLISDSKADANPQPHRGVVVAFNNHRRAEAKR